MDDLPIEVIEEAKKLLPDVAQYHHTNQELHLGKVTKEWKISLFMKSFMAEKLNSQTKRA